MNTVLMSLVQICQKHLRCFRLQPFQTLFFLDAYMIKIVKQVEHCVYMLIFASTCY